MNKCKVNLNAIESTSRWEDKDKHEKNKKVVNKFIDCLDKSSFLKIRDRDMANHLIIQRLAKTDRANNNVWDNLSTDTSSEKYFDKKSIKELTDVSLPIVFVDTDFLSRRKGNPVGVGGFGKGKQERVRNMIKDGKKFESVPIFNVKTNEVDEGNHRIDELKKLGVKSVPVYIGRAWD